MHPTCSNKFTILNISDEPGLKNLTDMLNQNLILPNFHISIKSKGLVLKFIWFGLKAIRAYSPYTGLTPKVVVDLKFLLFKTMTTFKNKILR